MKPVIIIPVLNPDDRLIELVDALKKKEYPIVIVNDGSQENINLFEMLQVHFQCKLCRHTENRGKGAALKTGILYGLSAYPNACGLITADADGQHSAEDIQTIAETLERNPECMVLGVRNLSGRSIPVKSIVGNRITSFVYFLSTGKWCPDTQTGLRGFPRKYESVLLETPGERYEYEMNLLIEIGRLKIPVLMVPITTIYHDGNRASHFHPLKDSMKIYLNIMKYSFSSLLSAAADLTLFTLFSYLIFGYGSAGILASTVTARLSSGIMNFMMNKVWVFDRGEPSVREALGYLSLFLFQMGASWVLVTALQKTGIQLILIKMFIDTSLFLISYQIQKNLIFKNREKRRAVSG